MTPGDGPNPHTSDLGGRSLDLNGTASSAAPDQQSQGQIDWSRAAAIGRRVVKPGPRATASEISELVAELRAAAARAADPVRQTSRLSTPPGAPDPLIVDRAGWIDANAASLGALLDPVLQRATQQLEQPAEPSRVKGMLNSVSTGVAAAEAGAVLGWVSSKVLGQYDLAPQGDPRLLLVAPNIMAVEQELDVDPGDFRLWVCLHEETHRVQFTAVPWLRGHLIDAATALGEDAVPDPEHLAERVQEILSALPRVLRGEQDITTVLATPEQRERLADITAVMSLLEGHADVVMDEVGPAVVPTVETIRQRFNERRRGRGGIDRVLRRLLGLEAKMRQYRDGAGFVRAVIDQVGIDGFNAVWAEPASLPRAAEITSPGDWVARVHG